MTPSCWLHITPMLPWVVDATRSMTAEDELDRLPWSAVFTEMGALEACEAFGISLADEEAWK